MSLTNNPAPATQAPALSAQPGAQKGGSDEG